MALSEMNGAITFKEIVENKRLRSIVLELHNDKARIIDKQHEVAVDDIMKLKIKKTQASLRGKNG